MPHLAAFAHCCKTIPLFTRIPVYATRPVIDLGRTLLQDLYASSAAAATTVPRETLSEVAASSASAHGFLLQPPTPDEIARFFSSVQALKYSQPHQPLGSPFSPPLNGLTITAYNAGHTLGGTIWHIQHGLESIVYAVDWNQGRENVFAGAAWLGGAGGGGAEVIEQLRKPTALVCSTRGSGKTAQAVGRAKRDEQLLDMIRVGIAKGGTVLIPIDSSARVLEVAYLLEHAWRTDGTDGEFGSSLRAAKLYLAGRNMASTMRYARSMLEWMDDSIVREFEAVADGLRKSGNDKKEAGPFEFRHMRLVDRKAQIEHLLRQTDASAPRVILASDWSIDWGFSKDVLRSIAHDPRNMVILTKKPGLGPEVPSIGRTLWEWWRDRPDGVSGDQNKDGENLELVYTAGRELAFSHDTKQPLEGDELSLYQQWLATQRQLQATAAGGATGVDASADPADDASESSSSSDESDTEQQGKALTVSVTMHQASRKVMLNDEDLGVNILTKRKHVHDFFCHARKDRDRAFPVIIRRRRMDDDYGEPIRHEDYVKTEERFDKEQDNTRREDDSKLGKKRKWGESERAASAGEGWRNRGAQDGPEEVDMLQSTSGFLPDAELDDLEDAPGEEPQGPCKLVTTTETVTCGLRIGFVDFSGVHDRRSLHMLIPLIQPRKLILVAGEEEETLALAEDCKALLSVTAEGEQQTSAVSVYTPAVGTWVNASVDTNAWVVKLSDPLVRTLQWQTVKGLSVATISGQVMREIATASSDANREDGSNKRQKTEEPEEVPSASSAVVPTGASKAASAASAMPILDLATGLAAMRVGGPLQRPLHVGDVRLTELRKGLQAKGHTADFKAEGTLVVDGCVIVRKSSAGRIEIETWGAPSLTAGPGRGRSTFYEIRRMVYDALAVVGA